MSVTRGKFDGNFGCLPRMVYEQLLSPIQLLLHRAPKDPVYHHAFPVLLQLLQWVVGTFRDG